MFLSFSKCFSSSAQGPRQLFPANEPFPVTPSVMTFLLTSSPFLSVFLPDQKRCAQVLTARPWSGFFRSLDAASAHWVLKGSWFSSLKHFILSKVPMINVMAASCALESLISSSYRENAWGTRSRRDLYYHLLEHLLKYFPPKLPSCEMLCSPFRSQHADPSFGKTKDTADTGKILTTCNEGTCFIFCLTQSSHTELIKELLTPWNTHAKTHLEILNLIIAPSNWSIFLFQTNQYDSSVMEFQDGGKGVVTHSMSRKSMCTTTVTTTGDWT